MKINPKLIKGVKIAGKLIVFLVLVGIVVVAARDYISLHNQVARINGQVVKLSEPTTTPALTATPSATPTVYFAPVRTYPKVVLPTKAIK